MSFFMDLNILNQMLNAASLNSHVMCFYVGGWGVLFIGNDILHKLGKVLRHIIARVSLMSNSCRA